MPLCEQLAMQMASFLESRIEQGDIPPPKTFTGVRTDGQQFICAMSLIPIDRGEHLDFMREVLRYENCTTFAYSVNVTTESEMQLLIFSGQAGDYRAYTYQYTHDGLYLCSEESSEAPLVFFQELLPNDYKASVSQAELLKTWQQERLNVAWRDLT